MSSAKDWVSYNTDHLVKMLREQISPQNLIKPDYDTDLFEMAGKLQKITLSPQGQIVKDLTGATLIETSKNCMYTVINKEFIKIKTRDNADSLALEAIYTKFISDKTHIFPRYKNNTLVTHPAFQGKLYQSLSTEYLDEFVELGKYIRIIGKNVDTINIILNYVIETLKAYYTFASQYKLTHNDMHLNNLMLKSGTPLKIIDFGRAHIPKGFISDDLINEVLEKYGVQQAGMPIFSMLENMNKYAIRHDLGFMCDITTVIFLILPMVQFRWPEWCWITQDKRLVVNYKLLLSSKFPFNSFVHHALAWLVCTLYAMYLPNDKHDQHVFIIQDILDYGLMLPNGVYNARYFPEYSENAARLYRNIFSSSQTGGNPELYKFNEYVVYDPDEWLTDDKLTSTAELLARNGEALLTKKTISIPKYEMRGEHINYTDLLNYISRLFKMQNSPQIQEPWMNQRGPYLSKPLLAHGGKTKKPQAFKIYVEKSSQRKYVRRSKTRWYLDEHRGKYRYLDELKSSIRILI